MTESNTELSLHLLPQSPGAAMRSAREKAGVHLAVMSANLKVSIKHLEALEADQFDQFFEPVFARALAAKVCRFLRIDSQPILALMPQMTNGLKPLNLIQSERKSSFNLQRLDQFSDALLDGRKLFIFMVLLGILLWTFSADLQRQISHFSAKPEAAEVVPTMPPVQEQVAPEAASSDLPKAMVFDSSTPAIDTQPRPNSNASNPPTQELKK